MTTNRSAFVLNEFRYTIADNPTVKTRYPKARSVTIDTQMDEIRAQMLAAKVLAANEDPIVYELVLEGTLFPDDFKNGIPTFIPNFPKFATDGREMKVTSFNSDLDSNLTTIRIRG